MMKHWRIVLALAVVGALVDAIVVAAISCRGQAPIGLKTIVLIPGC